MDEINIGPKRDLRWPSRRCLAAAAAVGLIAAAVTLIVTRGGGRPAPRPPGAPAVAAAPSPSPAAPGTLLLTCDSANWGQLPSDWRAHSLRAGPLWFVSSDRPPGYVRLGGPPGARRTARLLRPGARFIFTTWEFAATPAGWPAQLNQHRDLLSEAGLALRACEETPDWRRRQLAVYDGILAAEPSLRAELGEDAAASLIDEAREVPALLHDGRRVLIIAARPQ